VSQPPEGIHQDEVTDWMVAQLPEIEPPLTFTLIAGGRSNLTFRVEDGQGQAWALRRPPLHHVLPTAHDISR
jgi:aminoglycoside phosphotransferase (APT) family kinase protein